MIDSVIKMLSYPFMQKAVIVGLPVALCAALLGVSLVLKRYSMIGDGLSHVGFGALAIATVLNFSPLIFSVPIVIICAFLFLRVSEASNIKGDSLIAMISTGALAIGVMVISAKKGMNIDISSFMFGSILSISDSDVIISVILGLIVIALYIFFYSKIFSITFDETFAKATGLNTSVYNMLLAVLTAVTIVIGMRLMGSLLISSLIIFPAITAMQLFRSYKSVIICSAILSAFCFITGMIITYFASLPAGPSIVCTNIAAFFVFYIISLIRRLKYD